MRCPVPTQAVLFSLCVVPASAMLLLLRAVLTRAKLLRQAMVLGVPEAPPFPPLVSTELLGDLQVPVYCLTHVPICSCAF